MAFADIADEAADATDWGDGASTGAGASAEIPSDQDPDYNPLFGASWSGDPTGVSSAGAGAGPDAAQGGDSEPAGSAPSWAQRLGAVGAISDVLRPAIGDALSAPAGSLTREGVAERAGDVLGGVLASGAVAADHFGGLVGRTLGYLTDLPDDDPGIRSSLAQLLDQHQAALDQLRAQAGGDVGGSSDSRVPSASDDDDDDDADEDEGVWGTAEPAAPVAGLTEASDSQGGYIWPVPGNGTPAVARAVGANGLRFSDGRYSPDGKLRGRPHYGIDLPAKLGDPVAAAGDGVVRSKGWAKGWGNYIAIQHPDGYISVYGHLSAIAPLKTGEAVAQGQTVGKVGNSGNARNKGTHLHLEVRKDIGPRSLLSVQNGGQTVDPTKWINGQLSPRVNNQSGGGNVSA